MKINSKKFKKFFILLLISISVFGFSFFSNPLKVLSDCVRGVDEYCLLEPLPLTDSNTVVDKVNLATYIPQLIRLIIALAGALAVIMLIFAGFQYISSDGFGKKSNAKEKIQSALLGLLLIIGSYAILYTINPDALSLDFNKMKAVPESKQDLSTNIPQTTTPPPSGAPTPEGKECSGCVYTTSADFPQKPPGTGCATTLPQGKCQVYSGFVNKFKSMAIYMKQQNIGWQVTEMYPPTVKHEETCHYNGTCVDASLTSEKNAANIKVLLDEIMNNVSSNFIYEVATDSRLNQLRNDPLLVEFKDKIVKTGAREHAHIRYQ